MLTSAFLLMAGIGMAEGKPPAGPDGFLEVEAIIVPFYRFRAESLAIMMGGSDPEAHLRKMMEEDRRLFAEVKKRLGAFENLHREKKARLARLHSLIAKMDPESFLTPQAAFVETEVHAEVEAMDRLLGRVRNASTYESVLPARTTSNNTPMFMELLAGELASPFLTWFGRGCRDASGASSPGSDGTAEADQLLSGMSYFSTGPLRSVFRLSELPELSHKVREFDIDYVPATSLNFWSRATVSYDPAKRVVRAREISRRKILPHLPLYGKSGTNYLPSRKGDRLSAAQMQRLRAEILGK